MRILIISFYYSPDIGPGPLRIKSLVDSLVKLNIRNLSIDVLTTMPNRYHTLSIEALAADYADSVSVYRFTTPSHKSGMLDQARSFFSFAYKAIRKSQDKKYDLVFASSSRLMTALLGAYIAKKNHLPLYLDIRDIFVDTIKDVLPKYWAVLTKPIFSLIERWTISAAHKVNLVSKGFSEYFSTRYPNQSYSYFTNGIDDEFLSLQKQKTVARKKQFINVLYAGNLGEGQGLHKIIPNLAKIMYGKVHFTVIGDGGRKEALSAALISEGINNVLLLPPMKRKDLLEAYQMADVLFLHLNDYDAFKKVLPSKIFEYGSLGKPIWAGVAGYAAEFINIELDNVATFNPCDATEAKQVFQKLDMGYTNRDSFIAKFSRKNIMKEMAIDVLNTSSISKVKNTK